MAADTRSYVNGKDTPLLEIVFQEIEKSPEGSISFSDFVELALYHPEHGYYASPERRKVGRRGDFYTSVSVGELFGFLLGEKIVAAWKEHFDSGTPFVIIEQGAHDGQLASDILSALVVNERVDTNQITYRIVDPRSETRAFLRERFADSKIPVEIVGTLEEARAAQGIFLCNELLDAFPFDRVMFSDGEWNNLRVTRHEGALAWTAGDLAPEQKPLLEKCEGEYPEGYVTEICPALFPWMKETGQFFDKGLWWIIDYGYGADDYFAPRRKTGTLRCYRDHQVTEDPFSFPGETDITAHVNFTHLREAAKANGLEWRKFTDQHHFLVDAAKSWLLSIEGKAAEREFAKQLRQFQTLTHPSLMGQQFKVAELGKSL